MKRPDLYHKTVDILVQAYYNDTLEHGNPCGCAVGNIVAANMGIELAVVHPCHKSKIGPAHFGPDDDKCAIRPDGNGAWWNAISWGKVDEDMINGVIQTQIESTGYSADELCKIEVAFERADWGDSADQRMFNGLMAVIDVLDQIHENADAGVTTTTKKKFHKSQTA